MSLEDRLRLKLKVKTNISLCMAIMLDHPSIYTVLPYCVILLVPLGVQSPPQGRGTVGEGVPEPLCTHSQNHTSSWFNRDSAMSGTLREGEGMTERVKEGE